MTYFYVYIIISLLCVFAESKGLSENRKHWNLIFALFPVFCLLAFKDTNVGNDTSNYRYMYEIINEQLYLDDYDGIETGYNYFQKILYSISPDSQILMIAVALITCVSCYYFFRDSSSCPCLSLYFFMQAGFLTFALSGLRQTIAISICLFAYRFIKSRKIYHFIVVIVIAMTFHKSAAFFIPAYYIANQRLETKRIVYIMLGMIVLFVFADKVLLFAADTLSYNYGVEETGNGYIFFALVALITYFGVKHRYALVNNNFANQTILNINFLTLAMWTLRLVSRTAERVSFYFLPFTAILLTETIETSNKENRLIIKLMCLFIVTYLFLYRIGRDGDINNYKFFFQL